MKNKFELAHIGINSENEEEAVKLCTLLGDLFNLELKRGKKSLFAGEYFECLKYPFLGRNGHIAMRTENLEEAMKELKERGYQFRMETASFAENGTINNVYLDGEFGGFAIHIMQRKQKEI